jgi:hypothetical protein
VFTARYVLHSTFCPHSVFMCFVWIWEQTAIISLYSIDCLVFITEKECVYCAVRTKVLGVFAKLRKPTTSSLMSVRPSVRMEQLCSHWTDFHDSWYLGIFRKSVEKIQVYLQKDKNSGHFTWRPYTFLFISRSILLRMKNLSGKSFREIRNTHLMFDVF